LFQAYGLGDLAELIEILGIPARLGKYPRGATDDEKATLLTAVTTLGHSAAGIIPEGMAIDYLEAAKADGLTHKVMLDWCERAKSKVILGGTLTTGTDGGSGAYALGEVHERGLMSLIASDARQYAGTLRRDLLWPMAALNFGVDTPQRAPRFFLDLGDTEDYKVLAETLPTFVDMGLTIPVWWLHEKTRIPRPATKDAILHPRTGAPAATGAGAQPTAAAALSAATGCCPGHDALSASASAANPQAPAAWTDQLSADLAPGIDRILGQVRAMLRGAASLQDFAAMLRNAYPDLDQSALRAAISDGLGAARLAGAADADDATEQD
jgi:phage gp29-like protein